MTEPTQEELDTARRESVLISKAEVMRVTQRHFCVAIESLKRRCEYDQNIMGNFITTLELELKKELKLIKTHKP